MLIENATTCRGKLGVTDFDCSCWDSGFLFRQSWKYSVPGQQNPEKNVAKSKLTISCFVLIPSLPRCVCAEQALVPAPRVTGCCWCPASENLRNQFATGQNVKTGNGIFWAQTRSLHLVKSWNQSSRKVNTSAANQNQNYCTVTAQVSLGEIHLPDLQLQGPYSLTSQWPNV